MDFYLFSRIGFLLQEYKKKRLIKYLRSRHWYTWSPQNHGGFNKHRTFIQVAIAINPRCSQETGKMLIG